MKYIFNNWIELLLGISILSLGAAFIAEHYYNLPPCEMCLKQRHSYYAIIIFIIFFYFIKQKNKILILLLIEISLIYGLFYAIWHVGIEQKILPGPSSCTGSILQTDSLENLKQQIKDQPVIDCSEIIWSIGGLSAATINSILLLLIFVINSIYSLKYLNVLKKK